MSYIRPAEYVYCPDCGEQIEAQGAVRCFACDKLICPSCRPDVEWDAEACAGHLGAAFANVKRQRDDSVAELERLRLAVFELRVETEIAQREAA